MDRGTLYVRGAPSRYFTKAASVRGQFAIFISHQGQDSELAELLARNISALGIACYVDLLDPSVDGSDPSLESYLRDVIRSCRGLLAIVSRDTSSSWWVPLEIGAALEAGKQIGTYQIGYVNLPTYLWQWPLMDDMTQAKQWARAVLRQDATHTHGRWRSRNRRERPDRDVFFNML